MIHMPESRFTAFFGHLAISACLFLGLVALAYFILLPGFLFYSEGGSTILSLIGGVDVVLGPLITLIIYKKSKPGIKLDLSIIAAIQITALLYGIYSLWSVRPLAVFYTQGTYYVVYSSTFESPLYTDISSIEALNQFKTPTLSISIPENQNLENLILNHALSYGESYFSQTQLYGDYQAEIPKLKNYSISPTQAIERYIIAKDSSLANMNERDYGFFKFQGSLHSGYILLELETGKFVDIVM